MFHVFVVQNSRKTVKIIFETALSLFKQYYGTCNVTVLAHSAFTGLGFNDES